MELTVPRRNLATRSQPAGLREVKKAHCCACVPGKSQDSARNAQSAPGSPEYQVTSPQQSKDFCAGVTGGS